MFLLNFPSLILILDDFILDNEVNEFVWENTIKLKEKMNESRTRKRITKQESKVETVDYV